MKKLSIIVPMYNEEEMIPLFFEKMNDVISQINDYQTSLVCVNDGSRDNTLELLKNQRTTQNNIHIVSFSRNFGHEAAVAAGLKQCDGDIVVVMDADLQDPPELILEMIKKYEEGFEVVNAKRVNRKKDPFLKRITAEMFYNFIGKLSGKVKVPNNVGNFRLMTRKVVNYVNALTEKNHVFRVQVPFVGFKTTEVEFVRPERPKGQTHYNYGSMFRLAGDSITSVSIEPLRWSLKGGLFLFILSCIALLTIGVLAILEAYNILFLDHLQFAFILIFISLWSSLILMAIGLVGEYVGRTLIESQNRPLYYIDEEIKDEN